MSYMVGVEMSDHLSSLKRPSKTKKKDAKAKSSRRRRISNESRRRNRP